MLIFYIFVFVNSPGKIRNKKNIKKTKIQKTRLSASGSFCTSNNLTESPTPSEYAQDPLGKPVFCI